MTGLEIAIAAGALAGAVAAGLVAHELAHALALRLAGVEYSLEYFPGRSRGVIGALAIEPWALVRPDLSGREAPHALRLSALAPLSLSLPVLAGAALGPSPDDLAVTAAAIGWLACAVPSPQDFSVVWYAHRLLDDPARDARDSGGPDGVDGTLDAD